MLPSQCCCLAPPSPEDPVPSGPLGEPQGEPLSAAARLLFWLSIDILATDGRTAAAGFVPHGLRVKQVILGFRRLQKAPLRWVNLIEGYKSRSGGISRQHGSGKAIPYQRSYFKVHGFLFQCPHSVTSKSTVYYFKIHGQLSRQKAVTSKSTPVNGCKRSTNHTAATLAAESRF